MPKIRDLPLAIGGLMRCCTGTLDEEASREVKEGDFIDCKYEKKPTMVVRNGLIEWVGYEFATQWDKDHPK